MKATVARKQLIWFFETPDGTLMNEFGLNQLIAKMKLCQLINAPYSGYLKLVDTPLQSGRIAYEIESNKYGTVYKEKFLQIADSAFEFDNNAEWEKVCGVDPYHNPNMTPEKYIALGGTIITE